MRTQTRPLSFLRARSGEELASPLRRRLFRIWNAAALLLSSLGTTVLSLALAIGTYETDMFLGYFRHPALLLLNWLPVLLLQLLFFCLLNRQWAAFLAAALPVLAASVGNFYKIQFRFEPFTFQDMDSVAAGLRVAGDYPLTLNSRTLTAIAYVLLATPLLLLLARGRVRGRRRLIAAVLAAAAAVPLWLGLYSSDRIYRDLAQRNNYVGTLTPQEDFISSGFVYPFLHSIRQSADLPPEGYDPEAAAALLAGYEDKDVPAGRRVNLMVLQLESFTDLETMGFSHVAPECYAVLHRLQEESYSGTLVANVIGGGTIRTERCVLTGYFDMPNVTDDCPSYVRWFNSQGYFTTGSHPNRPDFYDRINVAEKLGFSEYLFLHNHYRPLTNGRWNCDDVFIPEAFRLFREAAAQDQPVFAFNVSLQGHAPFLASEVRLPGNWWLDDSVSPETQETLNSYLAQELETQELLWQELESLRSDPEPVVLLIYGDHNPAFGGDALYAECGVDFDLSTEEGFLRYYGTPYLIWANDAAKEQLGCDFTGEGPTVSPGYLMRVLFDLLGWEGSAFSQFTGEAMERLPLLSTNGGYVENGVFSRSLSPAGEALLRDYEWVQYYEHRLPVEEP